MRRRGTGLTLEQAVEDAQRNKARREGTPMPEPTRRSRLRPADRRKADLELSDAIGDVLDGWDSKKLTADQVWWVAEEVVRGLLDRAALTRGRFLVAAVVPAVEAWVRARAEWQARLDAFGAQLDLQRHVRDFPGEVEHKADQQQP